MLSFKSPKNYNELLPKLNLATFITTLVFFILLRFFNLVPLIEFNKILIPPLEEHKELIEWILSFGVIPVIAAFTALFFSSSFEMHNKVAKLLRVRFLWDKFFIAKPLAKKAAVEVQMTPCVVKKIMNELYYPEVKHIDQHYVELFWRYALWFWILFEHAIVAFVAAVILSIVHANAMVLVLWGYLACVVLVTALQLVFVTAQKSTDQANQLSANVVGKFFKGGFN